MAQDTTADLPEDEPKRLGLEAGSTLSKQVKDCPYPSGEERDRWLDGFSEGRVKYSPERHDIGNASAS